MSKFVVGARVAWRGYDDEPSTLRGTIKDVDLAGDVMSASVKWDDGDYDVQRFSNLIVVEETV